MLVAAAIGGAVVAAVKDDSSGSTNSTCNATKVADEGLPAVVTIHVQAPSGNGSGSGEVIRRDGEILTNNHVISSAASGGSVSVVFNDGTTEDAHIVGRDPDTDLAVVKVDGHTPPKVIAFGESSELRSGQPVVALGAPLGLSSSVTSGIVSGLNRSVRVPADQGRTALLVAAIQTDAAINPGNSGGALVDCDGKLVGVPTAGATVPNPQGGSSAGNIGIGFAIPSDFAKQISDELIAHGRATHSSFGIQVAPISATNATSAGVDHGLYVAAVTPGGPVAQAGLAVGDIVTKIDDDPATAADQLQALTLSKRPGDTVTLTFVRDGAEHEATVTLGSQQ